MSQQHRDTSELGLDLPFDHRDGGRPGKRGMTQGLVPRPIIFRVESAEAARELGAAFGSRDRNGVAEHAEAAVDRAASGSGAPLRDDLRERFESSLGADLSSVRVHTGGASVEASAAVGAKAYTVGNDIHFGAGQYQPDDPFGMHLIAHEVAHTQQQAGGTPQRQNKLDVSTPDDAAEHEADRAADAMVRGESVAVSSLGGAVNRQVLMRSEGEGGADSGTGEHGNGPGTDADTYDYEENNKPEPGPPLEEGGQTVNPPAPLNWSSTAATPMTPTGSWSGEPAFSHEWSAPGNLATHRAAFSGSWSTAQGSYNQMVKMNESIKAGEKELPPALFKASGNASVGAEAAHVNATDAFHGNALKSDVGKVDSAKVPDDVRNKIIDLRDVKIPAAENDVGNKINEVRSAKDQIENQKDSLNTAENALEIVWTDKQIQDAGLDKEQVKRDLEDFRSKIKATVDSVKAVTSIANIFTETDPAKMVQQTLKAVDNMATAGGSITEAAAISNANSVLKALDGNIASLNGKNAGLKATNADNAISTARRNVEIAKRTAENAFRNYQNSVKSRDALYREMATQMKAAGTASGMSAPNAQLLAGAVEALPKIRVVLKFIEGLQGNLPVPAYNESSGIGAAMATNVCTFTTNLGVVKGSKQYLTEQHDLWDQRLTAVQAVMAQATSVPGSDF
jgi:archaellum component FlaC